MAAVFRKRNGARNNTRSKATNDESEEDEINLETINDKKYEQTMRSRFSGVSADKFLKSTNNNAKDDSNENYAQFASQSEQSAHEPNSHDKLMQQYIDDKLGITKQVVEVPLTEDEKLYKVPDEIKQLGGGSTLVATARKATETVDVAGSTGIAEVLLPSTFKQRNIDATSRRLKLAEAANYLPTITNKRFKTDSGYYQRFQLNDVDARIAPTTDMFGLGYGEDNNEIDMEEFSETAPGAFSSGPLLPENKYDSLHQKATDNIVMEKFKKKQNQRFG